MDGEEIITAVDCQENEQGNPQPVIRIDDDEREHPHADEYVEQAEQGRK